MNNYLLNEDQPRQKSSIMTRLTKNKRSLKKFFGLVLITSVLNQTTFIFENNNNTAFEQYFNSGNDSYEPELVRIWWFSIQFITSLLSIWLVTKIQPTFFYGIMTLLFSASQFVLAFVEKDSLEGYAPIIGIAGGAASGSVLIVPIYLLWRNFDSDLKGIVFSGYFLCSGFLSNVVIYFSLRLIWWGSDSLPDTQKEIEV